MAEEKTFKELILEQKRNTSAIRDLIASNKETSDTAEQIASNSAPDSAASEEKQKEQNSYLRNTFQTFLGKGSSLAQGVSNLAGSLKAKVAGGLDGIFTAIKTGAFVAALFALQKFLESEFFQELTDKIIPKLAVALEKTVASFKKLGESIGNIGQTIDDIKSGFFDEEGNFTPIAGIKNALEEISELFDGAGIALATIGGLTVFAFRKSLLSLATGLTLKIANLFGVTSFFRDKITDVGDDMGRRNTRSTGSRGIFGKGARGIGSVFGRLFSRVGRFRGLLGVAAIGMTAALTASDAADGVFSKVKSGFNSMFNVVGDFAGKLTQVASKAAAKTASIVTGALDTIKNIGLKPNATGTSPKVTTDLGGGGTLKNPSGSGTAPKYGSGFDDMARAGTTPRLGGVSAVDKPFKVTPKKLTVAGMNRSFLKRGGMTALKMLPAVGIGAGLIFTASRLFSGDRVGAAAEFAGVFAPSVTGLPIDAGLMARDIYYDQFGIYPEQEPNSELRNQRMVTISNFLADKLKGRSKNGKASTVQPSTSNGGDIDFSKIRTFQDYRKVQGQLRVNPNYDIDNSGTYNRMEFAAAMAGAGRSRRTAMDKGPVFLQPTSIVTNNNTTMVSSRPIGDDSFAGLVSAR